MIHHVTRVSRHLIFWSLLIVAVGLTSLRLVLSGIESYKADLAGHVSELLGTPVTIGHLRAKMRGVSPELILTDIMVSAGQRSLKPAVALREVRVGFNLLDSVANQDLLSSAWITLVGAKFSVYRKTDGSFAIIGLQAGGEQPNWLWQGRKFEILQSEVTWQDFVKQRQPVIFHDIDMAISNQDQHHRINVLAKLPATYGKSLTAVLDFTGNPFTANAVSGKAYFNAKQVKFSTPLVNEWLKPQGITVNSGQGNVSVWAGLQQSQLAAVKGKLALQTVKLTHPNRGEFNVNSLATDFAWQHNQQSKQWQLLVPHIDLETSGKPHLNGGFSLTGQQSEIHTLGLTLTKLDVEATLRAGQFFAPPDDEQLRHFIPASAQGELSQLTLWADFQNHTGAVNGDFAKLSMAPMASNPGLDNFSGHIQGNEQAGVLQMTSENAQIVMPSIFREPLVIKRLQGPIAWRQQSQVWELSSQALQIDLSGIQTFSRLQFNVSKEGKLPFLDLQTALNCDDASQLKHYYPVGVMKPADTVWLDKAFVKGQIHNGKLLFIGHLGQPMATLQDFEVPESAVKTSDTVSKPDTENTEVVARELIGGGFFEALMDVDKLHLDYAPNWPLLTDISGKLRFLQGRMVVYGDGGHSYNLNASKVTVINPAIGISKQLMVKGLVDGEIADALLFLKNTPLRDRIGLVADAISTKGKTQVSLDLQVPLALGVQPEVNGTATLNQASLKILALDLPVSHVKGLLNFDEHGIYSDPIKAVALNHPVKVNILSNAGQTTLQAEGVADLGDIEQQFNLPKADFADGDVPYQLTFRLPLDDQPSDLLIESNLEGVELKLPGLIEKHRAEEQNLKLVFGLNDKLSMPISIHYADQMQAALQFDTTQHQLVSGHFVFGEGKAVQQQQAGIILDIQRKNLNLQNLLGLATGGGSASGDLPVREINLHADNASWGQASLGAFTLDIEPKGNVWQGRLKSPFAMGTLHLPAKFSPESTINIDLSLLDLSIIKQLHGQTESKPTISQASQPISPKTLPLLTLRSAKTVWETTDLGVMDLHTEHSADGMAIKNLSLKGAVQNLTITGDWTLKNHQAQTQLQGRLEMPKAGKFLTKLDLSHDLVGSDASVDFSAHWQGAPYEFALANLQGKAEVNFSEGRILSIDPGFGRVLGILAMEQWGKRLQLDFRDLYEEGLTFNSIKGSFSITDGEALTKDLRIDAIPAMISIKGTTNFINKTLDQQASVIPKSADAVPIAGTIVDRFTKLVARTLTGNDQNGFLLGSQYQLKGSWDAVQVLRLHDQDGVVPKIWGGLTDFSWLEAEKPVK